MKRDQTPASKLRSDKWFDFLLRSPDKSSWLRTKVKIPNPHGLDNVKLEIMSSKRVYFRKKEGFRMVTGSHEQQVSSSRRGGDECAMKKRKEKKYTFCTYLRFLKDQGNVDVTHSESPLGRRRRQQQQQQVCLYTTAMARRRREKEGG